MSNPFDYLLKRREQIEGEQQIQEKLAQEKKKKRKMFTDKYDKMVMEVLHYLHLAAYPKDEPKKEITASGAVWWYIGRGGYKDEETYKVLVRLEFDEEDKPIGFDCDGIRTGLSREELVETLKKINHPRT